MMNKLKRIIKRNFLGKMAVAKLHEIEGWLFPIFISDEKAVNAFYCKNVGKKLDLENPRTFSEKLNWYKVKVKDPLMAQCADKVSMREYVTQMGYGEHLNEVYGVYSDVSDIDIDSLPAQFVIKAAHGSHMNIIVKDKTMVNWKQSKWLMKSWLRQNIYWGGREWVYKDIPHRLIVEKYLEDSNGDLRDYKFFCFNGEPRFLQVDTERYGKRHVRNFYDLDWNWLDISDDVGSDESVQIAKPISFGEMIKMAQVLAKPFQFVRVDFYELSGKPYIGELTFFHNGGISRMMPEKWERIIGDYWKIEH